MQHIPDYDSIFKLCLVQFLKTVGKRDKYCTNLVQSFRAKDLDISGLDPHCKSQEEKCYTDRSNWESLCWWCGVILLALPMLVAGNGGDDGKEPTAPMNIPTTQPTMELPGKR